MDRVRNCVICPRPVLSGPERRLRLLSARDALLHGPRTGGDRYWSLGSSVPRRRGLTRTDEPANSRLTVIHRHSWDTGYRWVPSDGHYGKTRRDGTRQKTNPARSTGKVLRERTGRDRRDKTHGLSKHPSGVRPLGDHETESGQLAVDTRSSPNILSCHEPDRVAHLSVCAGTTRTSPLLLPPPVRLEASAVPSNNGLGLDSHEHVSPTWPCSLEEYPESPIGVRRRLPWLLHRHHRQLLPERHAPSRQVGPRAESRSK